MIASPKLTKTPIQVFEWSGITNLLISLSLACFVASLFLVSLFTTGEDIRGFWILLLGWFGLLIFQFAWYANMLNLLALLLLHKRPFISFMLSSLALLLATQSFYFTEIPTSTSGGKLFIKELGLGFYLWYFAQLVFLIATFIEIFQSKRSRQ